MPRGPVEKVGRSALGMPTWQGCAHPVIGQPMGGVKHRDPCWRRLKYLAPSHVVPDLFVKRYAGRSEHPSSSAALVGAGHASDGGASFRREPVFTP